jgi:enoyl-CoA hydratase/carnithine racemase
MEQDEALESREYTRPVVKVEETGDATVIRLVRPDRRNAMDLAMIRELSQAIRHANRNPHTRCVVIKGAGGNFSVGRDLSAAQEITRLGPVLEYDEAYVEVFENLAALSKPSVAVVQGLAVAGGFSIAMACDFVLAQSDAQFGALELKHGFPAAVNTVVLAHRITPRFALELLLTKKTVSAQRLLQMGLVNRIAADEEELNELADEYVAALAALDPVSVKLTKETHRAARNMPYADALVMAKQLNALLMTSGKISAAAAAASVRGRDNDA